MATKRKKDRNGYFKINRKVDPYKTKSGKISTQRTFYGKTVKEAEQKYQDYISGVDKTPAFFDDLMESFIQDTFLPDPRYKPRTKQRYIDSYRKNLEPQERFIHKSIRDITYQDIQKAYNAMKCAPSGVEACHKLLGHFFKLMLATGTIDRDPLIGVVVPEPDKKTATGEIVTFTDEEIEKVKTYINRHDLPAFEQKRVDRYRLLLLLAMNTGMRTSELLALRYDDIKDGNIFVNKQVSPVPIFENGKTTGYDLIIADPKSDKAVRSIPISEDILHAVEDHKQWHRKEMMKRGYRTDFIFTTSTGSLIDRRSLRHSLDRIHAAAGVPQYGLHTYRRTFASKLARSGEKMQVVAELLGHNDIAITDKFYVSISSEEKRNAISNLWTSQTAHI